MSRFHRSHPDWDPADELPIPVVPAFPPRCRCGHGESLHYRDRKGRPTCGISVCGCAEFRPDDLRAAMDRHPSGKDIT